MILNQIRTKTFSFETLNTLILTVVFQRGQRPVQLRDLDLAYGMEATDPGVKMKWFRTLGYPIGSRGLVTCLVLLQATEADAVW